MEALEKIRAFLERLKEQRAVDLPKLVFFADGSCSIRDGRDNDRIIRANDIEDLLNQIDNYQWDTNTDNQNTNPNTAPAKQ